MLLAQTSLTSGATGPGVVLASLSLVLLAMGLAPVVGSRYRASPDRSLVTCRGPAVRRRLCLLFDFRATAALYWAWLWVGVMVGVATIVVVRRAKHRIGGLALITTGAILGSALISVAVTFGFEVIAYDPVSLVVIAGITIGNAVPSAVLGVNQSVGLNRDRRGELEALLSLGFDRHQIVRFMAPRAARSSLIPQVERTKVVGLIALPGAMTGLLLAGVDPVEAVAVQLLVMYLVLGTAALCVVATVTAITRGAVTSDLLVADWVNEEEQDDS